MISVPVHTQYWHVFKVITLIPLLFNDFFSFRGICLNDWIGYGDELGKVMIKIRKNEGTVVIEGGVCAFSLGHST
jgi:hypothetical protein